MGGIKAHMDGEIELLSREVLPVFNYDLTKRGADVVRLVPIGDTHVGHKASLVDKLKGFLDYILETPNTYTILMGDLMENVLPDTVSKHRGAMWEQILTPSEQLVTLHKLLTPLAKKKKILYGVGGTHSLRSWYASGFDPEKALADELGYPFAEVDGLCNITVGEHVYTIHATHGTGSTSDPAAVLRKLLSQPRRVASADIYLRGHHHSKLVATDYHFDGMCGTPRKALYVGTGSFLGYVDGYAHRNTYLPAVPGAVKLKLYRDEWDVHATV
jgi:hypothetical protein